MLFGSCKGQRARGMLSTKSTRPRRQVAFPGHARLARAGMLLATAHVSPIHQRSSGNSFSGS